MSNKAPNIEAIKAWVQANRPDTMGTIEAILAADGRGDSQGVAMLWLLVAGFAAGRQYQVDHPTLGVHSFHTDPEFLHREPRESKEDVILISGWTKPSDGHPMSLHAKRAVKALRDLSHFALSAEDGKAQLDAIVASVRMNSGALRAFRFINDKPGDRDAAVSRLREVGFACD